MGLDYFTVSQLGIELHKTLLGRFISGASYSNGNLKLKIDQRGLLSFQCKPDGLILYNPNHTNRLPWPSKVDPVRYFVGARFIGVSMPERDRTLSFLLERFNQKREETTRGILICEMMNRRIDCALVSQENQRVLGGWGKEKRIIVGNSYTPPVKDYRMVLGFDSTDLIEDLKNPQAVNFLELIRKSFSGFDRPVSKEVLYRCGFDEKDPGTTLNLQKFWCTANEIFNNVGSLGGYLYEEGGTIHFTAVHPTRLPPTINVEKTDLLIDSINNFVNRQKIVDEYRSKKKETTRIIKRALKSLISKSVTLNTEFKETENEEITERKAHTLFAHLHQVSKDTKNLTLADVFKNNVEEMFYYNFDKNETPVEHAERLLKIAKKLKRRKEILPSILSKLDLEISDLKFCQKLLDERDNNLDDLRCWLTDKGYMDRNKKNSHGKIKASPNFGNPREYLTDDGWVILAGKNNKENDLLTHRIAGQNDLWFHAHGYPGSHVILKRNGHKNDPSKIAIEQAAAVAAFWSKGKTAKKVPVVFTLKKYVNKPKGAAPGQATLKREKTIIVQPELPSKKE